MTFVKNANLRARNRVVRVFVIGSNDVSILKNP